MPCDSGGYRGPDERQLESSRVIEFLKEITGQLFCHDEPNNYGRKAMLDTDTAALCDWCKSHDVSKQSLELQLWWKRHQAYDARREAEEAAEKKAQRKRLEREIANAQERLRKLAE